MHSNTDTRITTRAHHPMIELVCARARTTLRQIGAGRNAHSNRSALADVVVPIVTCDTTLSVGSGSNDDGSAPHSLRRTSSVISVRQLRRSHVNTTLGHVGATDPSRNLAIRVDAMCTNAASARRARASRLNRLHMFNTSCAVVGGVLAAGSVVAFDVTSALAVVVSVVVSGGVPVGAAAESSGGAVSSSLDAPPTGCSSTTGTIIHVAGTHTTQHTVECVRTITLLPLRLRRSRSLTAS
jgi:hypothetical protein